MKTIIIKVRDGEVLCSPERCVVAREDSVKWESKEGYAFNIHFGWKSPFKDRFFLAARNKKATAAARIMPDAPYDRYKYVVGVYDGKNVLVADPELIIRR